MARRTKKPPKRFDHGRFKARENQKPPTWCVHTLKDGSLCMGTTWYDLTIGVWQCKKCRAIWRCPSLKRMSMKIKKKRF